MHDFPQLEGHVEPDVWGTPMERDLVINDEKDPSI